MHLTIGLFGNREACMELAKKIAKPGTANDIAIFNHASSEGVFTYVVPDSEKVQPLLQALSMAEVPVLVIREITKEAGEAIIAIDSVGFEKGFIIASDSVREDVAAMVRGTSLEKFKYSDETGIRLEIMKTEVHRDPGILLIPIDNYFNVRSVGTVVLGIVKSGSLKKYDKLMVEPLGKEVMVKGIQSQDRDIESAEAGMRVGLSLKGVEADELRRGYVICNSMKKAQDFDLMLNRNRFSRQELKAGMQVGLCSGMQCITSVVESAEGNKIRLKALSPVAYSQGQKLILFSQADILPRIIGTSQII